MAGRNPKKIITGVIFILLAFIAGIFGFFYLEVKPKLASRQTTSQNNLSVQEQKIEERAAQIKREQISSSDQTVPIEALKTDGLTLDKLVDAASQVYDDKEFQRREGYLWVDRESSQYVATLGAMNGVLPGKTLNVYDGDEKIGSVSVATSFDVISHVEVPSALASKLAKNYYRIVLE
jgi:hypothetical protein